MAGLGGDGIKGWTSRLKARRSSSTGLLTKSVLYGQANQTRKVIWNDWLFAEVIFGSSATDTSISDITSGTLAQISDILQVRTGASGDLNFYVDLSFLATPPGPTKVASISVQWQYRTVGGAWTDAFTEIPDSGDSVWDTEIPGQDFGYLTSSQNKTDLSANTNYEVRLLGRLDGGNASAGMSAPVVSVTAIASGVTVAITGQSTSLVGGAVIPSFVKTLTGLPAALSAGTLVSTKTLTLSGQNNTLQHGAVTASTGFVVDISGNSVVASLGTLAKSLEKSLSGQAAVASVGTTTTNAVVSITGLSAPAALGVLSSTTSKALIGQTLPLSQDSVTTSSPVVISISGQGLALSQASVTTAKITSLTGQNTSLVQSSVSVESGVVVSITGQSLTASRGTVATARTVSATGNTASVQQGFTQVGSDVTVFLTGATAQLALGTLTAGKQASIAGIQGSLSSGNLSSSRGLALNGIVVQTFTATIGSTIPSPAVEYDVRLFDGLRSQGNRRNPYKSVRGLEHAMWGRVLSKCEYVPYVYYATSAPSILRIGYGRPLTGTKEQEEAALGKNREAVWLNSKLTEFYQRLLSANPTAELHEILTSTLYYYQVECQKSA